MGHVYITKKVSNRILGFVNNFNRMPHFLNISVSILSVSEIQETRNTQNIDEPAIITDTHD